MIGQQNTVQTSTKAVSVKSHASQALRTAEEDDMMVLLHVIIIYKENVQARARNTEMEGKDAEEEAVEFACKSLLSGEHVVLYETCTTGSSYRESAT